MTGPELLPRLEALACPFCSSHDVAIAFTRVDAETNWWNGECRHCGVQGPPFNTEAEAIAAWNTRPKLPLAAGLPPVKKQCANPHCSCRDLAEQLDRLGTDYRYSDEWFGNFVRSRLAAILAALRQPNASSIAPVGEGLVMSPATVELRRLCNETIAMVNRGRGVETPGFQTINALLKACDKVFAEQRETGEDLVGEELVECAGRAIHAKIGQRIGRGGLYEQYRSLFDDAARAALAQLPAPDTEVGND